MTFGSGSCDVTTQGICLGLYLAAMRPRDGDSEQEMYEPVQVEYK